MRACAFIAPLPPPPRIRRACVIMRDKLELETRVAKANDKKRAKAIAEKRAKAIAEKRAKAIDELNEQSIMINASVNNVYLSLSNDYIKVDDACTTELASAEDDYREKFFEYPCVYPWLGLGLGGEFCYQNTPEEQAKIEAIYALPEEQAKKDAIFAYLENIYG